MIIWVEETDAGYVGHCVVLTIDGPAKSSTAPQRMWHEARSIISTAAAHRDLQAAEDLRSWARKNGWSSTDEAREMLGW